MKRALLAMFICASLFFFTHAHEDDGAHCELDGDCIAECHDDRCTADCQNSHWNNQEECRELVWPWARIICYSTANSTFTACLASCPSYDPELCDISDNKPPGLQTEKNYDLREACDFFLFYRKPPPLFSFVGEKMIFAVLLCLTSHQGISEAINAKPMHTSIIAEASNRVSGVKRYMNRGMIIFSFRDKEIVFFDLKTQGMSVIARQGQAPNEMNGGFTVGNVMDENIIFKEPGSLKLKAFSLGDDEFKTVMDRSILWDTNNFVRYRDKLVGVIMNPGNDLPDTPEHALARFKITERGFWALDATLYDAELTGHTELDRWYAIRTELRHANTPGHFYRVPMWGSPVFQIWDFEGNMINEIAYPHPRAHRLPKDPSQKLERYLRKQRQRVVANCDGDAKGNIHLLLGTLSHEGKDYSGKIIVVMNEEGKIIRVNRSEHKIYFFAVSEDGNSYYAYDQDGEHFMKLSAY